MLLQESEKMVPATREFVWPDWNCIRESQCLPSQRPKDLECDNADQLWKKEGKIWIPQKDKELQLKILVVSHCGTTRHCGTDATLSIYLKPSGDLLWNRTSVSWCAVASTAY